MPCIRTKGRKRKENMENQEKYKDIAERRKEKNERKVRQK